MRPLIVGDRVRVYGTNTKNMTLKGTISSFILGMPMVSPDGHPDSSYSYHPKQCRLLKKITRRKFWLNIYPSGLKNVHSSLSLADSNASTTRLECIEVIEVRKKAKP